MQSSFTPVNKVFIVTGASSGIGRSFCIRLVRKGAFVVAAARNRELLNTLYMEIGNDTDRFHTVICDVTREEDVLQLFDETLSRFGRIDVLIANAGQYIRGRLIHSEIDIYRQAMEVNYFGTLNCIKAAWSRMSSSQSGHIVVINSLDAKKGITGDGPYVAAKSALAGLADVLRQEGKELGIHVLSVFPGRVDTPMISHLDVPWISPKISVDKVIDATLQGLKKRKAEVVVPATLAPVGILNFLFPGFTDWAYKKLNIEGNSRS